MYGRLVGEVHHFAHAELSEEEQLAMALSLSMEEHEQQPMTTELQRSALQGGETSSMDTGRI